MNRWRQRLDELRSEVRERSCAISCAVQISVLVAAFEQSERFEQQIECAAAEPIRAASWSEAQEERAAIVEHDGRIPSTWAEGFTRLDPDHPPSDVPAKRWLRFIDDVGRFLDGPFCAVATALGWGSYDLFGCDRDRPFARIDYAGLLWLLNGDKLIALTENTATIETRTGARQTYRRKPTDPGRVLAWELGRE